VEAENPAEPRPWTNALSWKPSSVGPLTGGSPPRRNGWPRAQYASRTISGLILPATVVGSSNTACGNVPWEHTNITFASESTVQGLVYASGRVRGVRYQQSGEAYALAADFVVDAGGRGSHAPRWLTELGFQAPEETTIDVDIAYASTKFRVPETYDEPERLLIAAAGVGSNVESRIGERLDATSSKRQRPTATEHIIAAEKIT